MPRRILEGIVTSDKMDKTITVEVERRYKHPMYKKYIRKNDKYAAHDPANQYKEGDRARIIECAPISKRKRWIVVDADGQEKAVKTEAPKKAEAKKAAPKKEAAKKEPPKKEEAKKAPAKKPAAKKKTTTKKKTDSKKD